MAGIKLTHVSIRDEEYGWRHITSQEAKQLFPDQPVSAGEKVFMCELCGQYVAFVNSHACTRYFKHSRGEEDKNCAERSNQYNIYPSVQPGRYQLPLRLKIKGTSFSLSIGIPQFGAFDVDAKVRIYGKDTQIHTFSLAERIQESGISWLDIQQDIAPKYKIQQIGFMGVYWPDYIPGINPIGALFDSRDRRMLQTDDEVTVGCVYYLLTSRYQYYCSGIICTEQACTTIQGKSWRVYRVQATKFSSETVRFFLLLKAHLVKKPIALQILWPSTVSQQGTTFHNTAALYVAHSGGEKLRLLLMPLNGQWQPQNFGSYFCVESNGFQQMVAIQYHNGQTNRSNHAMLWRAPFFKSVEEPKVLFLDRNGILLEDSSYTRLPPQGMLTVLAAFDGQLIVQRGKITQSVQMLKADERKTIQVSTGDTVKVLQGCDVAASIMFHHPKNEAPDKDLSEILLGMIDKPARRYVPINHMFGCVVHRLPIDFVLKRKIRSCIQAGKISEEAYQYIVNCVANHS